MEGEVEQSQSGIVVLKTQTVKNVVAQADRLGVVNTLNATNQGDSILPTGDPNVRYIHAEACVSSIEL